MDEDQAVFEQLYFNLKRLQEVEFHSIKNLQ